MSSEDSLRSSIRRIEQTNETCRVCRSNLLLVVTKGNSHDRVRKWLEFFHQSAVGGIPDSQDLVRTTRQPLCSISVDGQVRRTHFRLKRRGRLGNRDVPQTDAVVE